MYQSAQRTVLVLHHYVQSEGGNGTILRYYIR